IDGGLVVLAGQRGVGSVPEKQVAVDIPVGHRRCGGSRGSDFARTGDILKDVIFDGEIGNVHGPGFGMQSVLSGVVVGEPVVVPGHGLVHGTAAPRDVEQKHVGADVVDVT